MPDFSITAGDTSKTIYLRLRDSTTGLAKTGLVYNSAGVTCSYTLPLAARAAISLVTQTVTGAWSSGGFVEVDATNCKGLYRLDLPDAAIASGHFTIISIEFDSVIEESIMIPLYGLANAALDTAIAELGVAAPTATPTLRTGLMLLYMALRNKTVVQTSGTDALEIYNNAGTKIAAKLLTDDGSDYTEAEMA